jgi:hypothetical protein
VKQISRDEGQASTFSKKPRPESPYFVPLLPSNVPVERLEIYARRRQSKQSMETEKVSAGD